MSSRLSRLSLLLLGIVEILVIVSVGLFELSKALGMAMAPGDYVEIARDFTQMRYAPASEHWRALAIPGLPHLSVLLAFGAHVAVGCLLLASAIWRVIAGASSLHLTIAGLLSGAAYYLVLLFLAGWLRVSPTTVIDFAGLYVVLACYFLIRQHFPPE